MSSAATACALRIALQMLAAGTPGALRAQVRPAGDDLTTPRPRGLALRLAGGFAADAPLGVSRLVGGLGYASRRHTAYGQSPLSFGVTLRR